MKDWYKSKTLWANAFAGLAALVQTITGTVWFSPEAQVGLVAIVNAILRVITSEGLK